MAVESTFKAFFRLLVKITLLELIVILATTGYCWFVEDLSLHRIAITLNYAGIIVLAIGGISLIRLRTGAGLGGRGTIGVVSRSMIEQDQKDMPSPFWFTAVCVTAGLFAIAASEIIVRLIIIE